MVVLTVLYCITIYAFVTQRYFQMLKLSAIYNTEQGTRVFCAHTFGDRLFVDDASSCVAGRAFKLETKVPAYILSFILCWGPALATNVYEAIDSSPTLVLDRQCT